MKRFKLLLLLALLGTPAAIAPALCAPAPQLIANGVSADIGWTKAKVKQQNGKPTRVSKDGNTWYYVSGKHTFTVHFKDEKVDSFPNAQG